MIVRVVLSFVLIVLFGAVLASLVALPRAWVVNRFSDQIHRLDSLPTEPKTAAIVFGAGLRWDGRPSVVLADRVATGVLLYEKGLVDQLVMSGTQRSGDYDEPAAMARLANSLGVPTEAIVLDHGGTRTIETCRQAVDIFSLKSAYLVSQKYHLPRALATCQALGLEAEGVAADLREYRAERYWRLREVPATLIALWESYLAAPRASRFSGQLPS